MITLNTSFDTPEEEAAIRAAMDHYNSANPTAMILDPTDYIEFVVKGAVGGWAKRYVTESAESLKNQLDLKTAEVAKLTGDLNSVKGELTTLRDRLPRAPGDPLPIQSPVDPSKVPGSLSPTIIVP